MTKPLIEKLNLDDVLVKFSIWRRYHLVASFWMTLGMTYSAVSYINYVLVAESVGYRCADNNSNVDVANGTLNLNNKTSTNAWCASAQPCMEWIYDKPESLVAEFQLACQDWKRTLVGTVHSVGYMVGVIIIGQLSDRFGRKMMGVTTGLLCAAFGFAKSFVSDYWTYIVLEFMEAAVDPYAPLFNLCIEMVAPDSRFSYAAICICGVGVSGLMFPLLAWSLPYWRTFLQVWYGHGLLFILLIYLIDESPRWLISKGETTKAVKIIKNVAKVSRIEIREDLSLLAYEKEESFSFSQAIADTLKSRTLLKRFFVCSTWWVVSTFVYHGMTINSVTLQGDKFINFGLSFVARIPGNVAIVYIMKKLNRKWPLILTYLACAVLCTGQPFVPKDINWLAVLMYMIGKLLSSSFFSITYVFTSELFPTHTRNSMQGLCSSVGRIGGILATQMPNLMVYWSGLPTALFGAASLTAGLVTFLVPDTADKSLPDTVCQAEALEDDAKTASWERRNRRKRSENASP